MRLRTRQRKQNKFHAAKAIEASFISKLPLTHDLVDVHNKTVDEVVERMRLNPDQESFFNVLDFVNALTIFLYSQDEKVFAHLKCNVPDAPLYLEYLGYEDVTNKVNAVQDGLIKAVKRAGKTGAWALDGETWRLLPEVVEMYKAIVEVMPIRLLHEVLAFLKASNDDTEHKFYRIGDKDADKCN